MRGSNWINLVILIAALWCCTRIYAFSRDLVHTASHVMTQVTEAAR